jgi:group I intron endonuclease
MIGIYKITNLINNKLYIGKSKNLSKREKYHFYYFKSNDKKFANCHLYNSMRFYGESNFRFEVLEECEESELTDLETKYIEQYKSNNPEFGYNKTNGGDGGDTFSKRSAESQEITRRKLKEYFTTNLIGIQTKSKKGQHITESYPEIKEKWDLNFKKSMKLLSERRLSGEFTDKEKALYESLKLSRRGSGNPMYIGYYLVFDSEDNLVGRFESIREAVKKTGWPYSSFNQRAIDGTKQKRGKFAGFRVERILA